MDLKNNLLENVLLFVGRQCYINMHILYYYVHTICYIYMHINGVIHTCIYIVLYIHAYTVLLLCISRTKLFKVNYETILKTFNLYKYLKFLKGNNFINLRQVQMGIAARN